MLVTVRSVSPDDPPFVECESEVGCLTGYWRGDVPPLPGASEHIELDADGPLTWGTGPAIVSALGPATHGESLSGRVENIDDDFVAVRVGGGVLLALSVAGEPPLAVLGRDVSVAPTSFSLWPMNV